jgi:hypothetical protein
MEKLTREQRVELQNYFKKHHPDVALPTIWRLREKLQNLAKIEPIWYHCCPNSCAAYTGTYADLDACPSKKCGLSRYDPATKKPRKRWPYYPISPRLIRQFSGVDAEKLTRYRASFDAQPDTAPLKDVFSGRWYKELRNKGYFSR